MRPQNFLLENFNPDWELLRSQKETLMNVMEDGDSIVEDELTGILNLIDYIQDQAIKSGIWTETEVFGKQNQYFEWAEKYKPIRNNIDENSSFDGVMFETYGAELNFILDQNKTNTKKVWTLIQGYDGGYIVAGLWHVNRLGYFITEIPWETGKEEFYNG